MTRRLDNLAREICKIRADYTCQRCGLVGGGHNVQWAHIEARRKKGEMLRWSQNNCLALCEGIGTNHCHSWFDNNKVASSAWLERNFPDKAAWLREDLGGKPRSESLAKHSVHDLLELETQLKKELKELRA
jgi:hypothetical protein